ncbi:zinc finger and BTB domain-containing protein 16-like isoform X2 [Lutzomyia longipalpis]|uniref:zinc finger and BTB domain-containing protein 16-like isoform X2 n=1 Tax=Lutzomyia longipalpis TaxID=7200 RepID=UPI00248415F3|nr:zinc finger and BTB domain-containing protein 16-like isoform X2 [Lutzomyia longipalpis]
MAKLVGKEAKSDGKIVNKGIIYPGEIKRQENNLPGEMVKFIITEIEENDPPTMGNDLEKPDLLSKKKTMTSRPSRIAPESSGISAALPSIIQFCSICNETLKSREALLEHMQTHPERAQGPLLSCWMCSRGFFHNATEAFMQHLQQQHSTEYQPGNGFICTHCLWKFPIIELYRTHLHTHFPAKMYTRIPPAYQEVKVMESKNKGGSQEKKGVLCINCLRNFKTKFDYRKHLRDHTNCFYCQKMCSTRQELLNHVESCHRGLPVDLSNSPVMCTICRTHHSDLPKLKKHLEEEHRKENILQGRNHNCSFFHKNEENPIRK